MKKGMVGVIGGVLGAAAATSVNKRICDEKIDACQKRLNKFKSYYAILNEWLVIKQSGKSIEQYFVEKKYKKIAIYGMGELGNRLYDDLRNTDVIVKYAIDRNADSTFSDIPVYGLEHDFSDVDVIVVTAVFDYEDIKKTLNDYTDDVISLEDIIFGV